MHIIFMSEKEIASSEDLLLASSNGSFITGYNFTSSFIQSHD